MLMPLNQLSVVSGIRCRGLTLKVTLIDQTAGIAFFSERLGNFRTAYIGSLYEGGFI